MAEAGAESRSRWAALADGVRRVRPKIYDVEIWGAVAWPLLVCAMLLVIGWRIHVLDRTVSDHRAYIRARDIRWEADVTAVLQALERIESRQRR